MKVAKVEFRSVILLLEGEEWEHAQNENSLMVYWPVTVRGKSGSIIRKAPPMPIEGDTLILKGISPVRKGVITGTIYQVLPMLVNERRRLYIAFDKRIPA